MRLFRIIICSDGPDAFTQSLTFSGGQFLLRLACPFVARASVFPPERGGYVRKRPVHSIPAIRPAFRAATVQASVRFHMLNNQPDCSKLLGKGSLNIRVHALPPGWGQSCHWLQEWIWERGRSPVISLFIIFPLPTL